MSDAFFDRLDVLYASGDHAAVEAFMLSALENSADDDAAAVLNELGSFYRGQSRYDEASAAYTKALERLEALGLSDTTRYGTVLLNNAGLLRLQGQYDEALAQFRKALTLSAGEDGDEYVHVSCYNNMALCYLAMGRGEAALDCATRALELVERRSDNTHELPVSLVNLASVCLRLGEYERAEAALERALSLYAAMPEENVHHAAALNARAALCVRRGLYDKALDDYEYSGRLTLRFFGENIEYASLLQSMAHVYAARGERAEAARLMGEAAGHFERILGPQHPQTLHALSTLARLSERGVEP